MANRQYVQVNKQKLLIDRNGLRSPSKEEYNNLPLSPNEAKEKGLNVYKNEEGTPINMRYKGRAKEGKYVEGIRYEPETVTQRKNTRGGNKRKELEDWTSPQHKKESNKIKKDIDAYNRGANPWKEPLSIDDNRFLRKEHDLKISDKIFKEHPNMPFKSGDPANMLGTTRLQFEPKDSMEQIYGDKYAVLFDRHEGGARYIDREVYDPWQHTHKQGHKLEKDFIEVLPKKVNSKKLFRNLSSVAGQSNNPLVNVGGDLVGAVIDGVSYMADPSRERAIDVLLSTGQAATSLAAVGLALVPIPGSRFAGFALMKIGDNIGKAERIWNLAREGAMRDTKVRRGGAIDPWKLK